MGLAVIAARTSSSGSNENSMGLEAEQAWSSRAPPLSSMMNSMSPCACVSHRRTRAPYNAHRRQHAAAYEGALQLSRDAVLCELSARRSQCSVTRACTLTLMP